MSAPSDARFATVFDRDLVAKYDAPTPRYTSYPTAPQFEPGFDAAALRRVLEETNAASAPAPPLSLYFHLPFCEELCLFCGCNVTIARDRSRAATYAEDLAREMDLVAPLVRKDRRVEQLHWGGGTPTFFPPDVLKRLFESVRARFAFAPAAEIGVEVDPRETTDAHLEALAACGFNRLSMGIQDFDPRVQAAVKRIQPEDMTRRTVEKARELAFESVNVDLIYGLPHQSLASFEITVDAVLRLRPDRIALFNFAYLPDMLRHQKTIEPAAMPDADEKLRILQMAVARFADAGFEFVGMDHFARPEDELCRALRAGTLHRNFQGYTTKAGLDMLSFGVSAIAQVGRAYAQNVKDVPGWTAAVRAGSLPVARGRILTDDDVVRRDAIMRLMCRFALAKREVESAHRIPSFDEYFADSLAALRPLEADGLVVTTPDAVTVTPRGRFLVRVVAARFDAYLASGGGEKKRFSRAI